MDLRKMSYRQKDRMLLPALGVLLLLCWFMAFGKTYQAICLNREMKQLGQQTESHDLSFNPQYSQRKLKALERILAGYKVKEGQWSDQLWLKSSSCAAALNVLVDYKLSGIPLEKDTLSAGQNQSVYFYGTYLPLVKLMDTLERSSGIGRISAIQIIAPRKDLVSQRKDKCVLRVDFKALEKLKQ